MCSSWFSRCVNLRCLLSCRSLLEQLRKLQAFVRQSTTKTTTAKTCTMVSAFSPSVCEGVSAALTSLGEMHLLRLMMPVHVLLRSVLIFLFPGRGSVLLLHSLPHHLLVWEQRATAGAQR